MFEDKMRFQFSITGHGKELYFDAEYDDSVHYGEILDDFVSKLEAVYGYSFDVVCKNYDQGIGIYHRGKDDDCQ